MIVFTCADNFEAMMSCIYDAWASRLGHRNIRLQTEPLGNLELFCEYRHLEADPDRAASVIRSIQEKISFSAYQMVYRAAISCMEDKLDAIYRFLLLGFSYGAAVTDMLGSPYVCRIFEINRKVGNEAHYFREFIRFKAMSDQVLAAYIEPRSDIIALLAPPFEDRMPSENWMIIDDNRRSALIHPKDEESYLTELTPSEYERLKELEDSDDPFIDLWKGFFEHIAIKQRANYRCQRGHMPLWYRKHATEFQP